MSLQILFLQINFKNQPKLKTIPCLFLPWARRQCRTWYRRLSRTWIRISPPRSSDSPSAPHCRTSARTETQQISQREGELLIAGTPAGFQYIIVVVLGVKTFLGVVHGLALLVVDGGVLGLVLDLALLLRDCVVLSSTNRFELSIIQTPGVV